LFNIGGEGQLFLAAFLTGLLGAKLTGFPPILSIFLILVLGFLIGGIWGLIPGIMKVRWGVHEVLSTIMLNYIVFNLTNYFVMLPSVKAPGQIPKTEDIASQFRFTSLKFLSSTTRLNIGFFIAILVCVILFIILFYTVFGFKVRASGTNLKAAELAGINTKKIILSSMFISGGLAGFAGVEQVAGIHHAFISPFPEGMGFLGIAVALVGRNNPVGVIFSAILFGALDAGGARVDMLTAVPREIIFVLEGIIILFVASEYLYSFFLSRKKI
ncbi:MAG: ABC transporter permease, partial [bacterium]|nr:ABC transporter permease [bacterium]